MQLYSTPEHAARVGPVPDRFAEGAARAAIKIIAPLEGHHHFGWSWANVRAVGYQHFVPS